MDLRNLRGIIPTLSTIMKRGGELDIAGMRSLVRFNLEKGVDGLAVGMVAGEFYKLNDNERRYLMDVVIEEAAGRVPVLVGTSYAGTEPAIEMSKYAKDIGADGIVVMPPYFMKNESLSYVYEHFSRVASEVDLPLMVQDAEEDILVPIPLDFYPKIVKEHSNVYMVKVESLAPLQRMKEIRELTGESVHLYGAKSIAEELRLGAYGHIPSSGLPDLFVELFRAYRSGVENLEESDAYQRYTMYLNFRARFPLLSANIEKEILRVRGVIDSTYVRGPRQEMRKSVQRELKKMVEEMGYAGDWRSPSRSSS